MPTNRPFFTNFFSAFRARSSTTFQAKSGSTTTSSAAAAATAATAASPSSLVSTAHVSTTVATATSSSPRTITKAGGEPSSSAHSRYVPPLSRSPAGCTCPSPRPNSPPNLSLSPPGTSTPLTRGRARRGSDSSNASGGFIDALGPEKWYIGGRSPAGEETFYRLGLVNSGAGKRVRSLDRLSL